MRHFSDSLLAKGALALGLATLGLAAPTRALEVHHDLGGSVEVRRMQIAALRTRGEEVRIEGLCVSACTLYLGLPQTCVAASATLGFHGPASPFPGRKLPKKEFERVSRLMAEHYPVLLRKWFLKTGRHLQGNYYVMSADQVIAMGAKAC